MSRTRKSGGGKRRTYRGQHRFEHWYRDNQVYFLTARCRDRFPAFAGEDAKAVFWDRFDHYTDHFGFTPWVTSLLDNHYHSIGYLRVGENLGTMMQRLHGSVAKLVNDLLECDGGPGARHLPFWRQSTHHDYFDGCLRDAKQGRLTYRYVLHQGGRQGIVDDYRLYPHTRVNIACESAIRRAQELGAFLAGVPYRRYECLAPPR